MDDNFDFLRNKPPDHKGKIDFGKSNITKEMYDFLVTVTGDLVAKSVIEFGPGASTYAFMEGGADNILSLKYDKTINDNEFKAFKQVKVMNFAKNTTDILNILNIKERYNLGFINLKDAVNPYDDLNLSVCALFASDIIIMTGSNRNVLTSHLFILQMLDRLKVDMTKWNNSIYIITKISDEFSRTITYTS